MCSRYSKSLALRDEDLVYTPLGGKDFGLIDYNCKIQGIFSYTLFVTVILWNFVYTYDIYLTVNKPLMYNEKYMFYYKIAVYFGALIIALVIYFPNIDSFTPVGYTHDVDWKL